MENTTEDKELLLNQWQTCVDMANSVSQRRDNMNNIFITLNLAIMAAVSITWDIKSLFILIAGITICILWMLNIRNYKLLNTAKFNVINSIEEKLPSAPFKDEWQFLKNSKKYMDSTTLERILPITFIILYISTVIAIIVIKCTSC
ncbi:RipA family octameric membrane protein [Roseburia inulinivorans]|uniref:RipA family octameric membrane protein n=1 Tax=Roseburia inulinivorans TaxID=360807 RepID=UPI0032BFBD65